MEFLAWSFAHWWLVLAIYILAFTIYACTVANSLIRNERAVANLNRGFIPHPDPDAGTDTESLPVARSNTGADDDDDSGTIITAQRAYDSGASPRSVLGVDGDVRPAGDVRGGNAVRHDPASLA